MAHTRTADKALKRNCASHNSKDASVGVTRLSRRAEPSFGGSGSVIVIVIVARQASRQV